MHVEGQNLSFSVPAVHGAWKGTVSADGKVLAGTWDQGSPMRWCLRGDMFVAAAKPSRVDGTWFGTLQAGGTSLRTQVHLKSDDKGKEYCAFDSLDQHAMGMECSNVVLNGDDFSFDLPAVQGHYRAKLSVDENTLAGTWTQGEGQPFAAGVDATGEGGRCGDNADADVSMRRWLR